MDVAGVPAGATSFAKAMVVRRGREHCERAAKAEAPRRLLKNA
jgi:hypothetical protein